jgi:phosphotransferase system enzyme I (PtsP)
MLTYCVPANKENSFLGLRSIRFSLRHRDIFTEKIRAIFRAGVDCNLKIMFPMIFSLEEFGLARKVVMDCVVDLGKSSAAYNRNPKIGMMVKVPAMIEIIE